MALLSSPENQDAVVKIWIAALAAIALAVGSARAGIGSVCSATGNDLRKYVLIRDARRATFGLVERTVHCSQAAPASVGDGSTDLQVIHVGRI